MAQRHGKLYAKAPFRWQKKRTWGKKFLFVFFGKAKDKKNWPAWVSKTDEERVENMTWVLVDKEPWIATEKIDGTSTTFTMKRGRGPFAKNEFYVCSRNVMFDKPDKQCFYDTNVYLEMAEKYNIKQHLEDMLGNYPEWDWVTIQGETYGAGIQKNNYDLNDHRFMAFNFITSADGRWGTKEMITFLNKGYHIPCVPYLGEITLPDTVEELRDYVHSAKSTVNGKIKEGVVFRKPDGSMSFKCVDPAYLIKYHS
jgi:RNA ligase (TIGR02306 family)